MEELFLVLRGTPAAFEAELDPAVGGISCSLAQGAEQIGVEIAHTRNLVIEDRRAAGEGTVGLVALATVLTAKLTELAAKDVDG